MKSKQEYIEDLKEIKDMMNRSSRFISLSGLSGISAGLTALVGAWFAHIKLFSEHVSGYESVVLTTNSLLDFVGLAIGILVIALVSGVFFTTRRARNKNLPLWDKQTKLMLINLAIPLVTGGVLCLILLMRGYIGLLAPLTLIFYGLALVNASKYTFNEIRSLGIIEILLGLVAVYLISYSLYFWAFGFGVLHIVYGIIMQIKYGS